MPKPVRKHRRFIDKRHDNVTTFQLVHRSQRDPLAADPDAPQRVLLQQLERRGAGDVNNDEVQQRREEQKKFGVYFDDNYDYLQHLKTKEAVAEWHEVEDSRVTQQKDEEKKTENKSKVQLPSSVFASEFEESVGLLNRAAPRSGPLVGVNADVLEVLETLDDAYEDVEVVKGEDLAKVFERDADAEDGDQGDDEEVELDDILAGIVSNGGGGGDSSGEYETDSEYDSEDDDEVPDMDGQFAFGKDETKSKFTEYSMSSSVVKRSEQLTILDDRFEAFFDTYEEDNTGGLDMEDIEGHKPETSSVMSKVISDFEREKATERQVPTFPAENIGRTFETVEEDGEEGEEEKETVRVDLERWDCESILSTYSNIYHHPKLISEPSKMLHRPIKISGKTGMPKDVLGKGLTVGALRQLDRETAAMDDDDEDDDQHETCTLASRVSQLSVRNRHETLEEKRERKQAFKEHKRERRVEKKCNQLAFKEEKERQEVNQLNNRMNIQGQKL